MKLDISNKNLQRIEVNFLNKLLKNENTDEQHVEIILLDNNSLSKLEGLDKFIQLKHVSFPMRPFARVADGYAQRQ